MAFIFDTSKGETPETIKRKRDLIRAIMGASRAPQNIGEGLNALGDGIVANVLDRRANRAESEGMAGASSLFDNIVSGLTGGSMGGFPAAPAAPSSPSSGGQANPVDMSGNEVFSGFMDTVKTGVSNPYALAAIAATGKHESGFNPKNAVRTWSDPSQSGQPGTAGGIMSWRGPRYQGLAKTGDLSPQGQAKYFLQEDPKLIAALNNAKSVEEAQSLMNNAWRFAGYNRQGGEAARRLQTARSLLPTFQGGPAAVAANEAMATGRPIPQQQSGPLPLLDDMFDARAGGPPTLPMDANGAPIVNQPVSVAANEDDILALEAQMAQQDPQAFQMPQQMVQQPIDRMTPQQGQAIAAASMPQPAPDLSGVNPQSMFQPVPQPMPQQATPQNALPVQQPPVQMAQAERPIPPMAGGPAPAIQQTGPSLQQLMQAAQNPWLNENQRAVVNMLIQQQFQQMEAERARQQRMQAAGAAGIDPRFATDDELWKQAAQKQFRDDRTGDIKEYEYGQQDPRLYEHIERMNRARAQNITIGGQQDPMWGNAPNDQVWLRDETGQVITEPDPSGRGVRPVSVPIAGSKADTEARKAAEEADSRSRAQTLSDADKADTTLDATQSVLDILDNAETPATGTLSRPFALYSGTPAGKVRSYVSTLQSGVALGAMQRLKEASATGATGFGSLSAPELNLLISDIGALDPDTTEPEIFRKTVQRINDRAKRVAEDIVKNVSPERIQELGLQLFIDGFMQRKNKSRVIDGYTIEQVDD